LIPPTRLRIDLGTEIDHHASKDRNWSCQRRILQTPAARVSLVYITPRLHRVIVWAYAFIDRPMPRLDVASAFWTVVTDTTLSPRRGEHDEFATLVPAHGDPYLKIQGVHGVGGAHIDLSTDDVHALRGDAEALGATTVAAHANWHVLRSPGGQLFCTVSFDGGVQRPGIVAAPNGARSRLDQICIDVTAASFDAEIAFWTALTGWPSRPSDRPEFHIVRPPASIPVGILIQRLGSQRSAADQARADQTRGDQTRGDQAPADQAPADQTRGDQTRGDQARGDEARGDQARGDQARGDEAGDDVPASAHLDLACSDVDAVRAWHEAHGAEFVAVGAGWTMMRDPAGGVYCLTSRDPMTGE
jgi:glyoxalase superfamily protein